ncbi:MAG: ABC transporter permease [Pseudomonadota bacterium]
MTITDQIGRQTIKSVRHFLDLFAFAARMGRLLLQRHGYGHAMVYRSTVKQVYFTAILALPVVCFIALIVGSIVIVQSVTYQNLTGGGFLLSDLIVILIVRELGPLFVAIIVVLRSGVAVTIEAGYMTVFKEMDLLQTMGIDPVHLIGIPRLLGITTATLCLFWVFDVTAIFGGYLVALAATDMPLEHLLSGIGKSISISDIFVPIIKALFFGIIIATNCLYRGFGVRHSIIEIPAVCSRAAVESLLYCLFVDIVISTMFYI